MTRFCTLLLLLCCSCALASAQSTLQHRPAPAAEYVLGTGDQVNISVADMEGLPDRPITIDPSGYIDLPMIGRVEASGLTLTQLKAELAQKLATYITKPEVAVNLASSGSQPVSVIGEVGSPGVHQLTGAKHLQEVLALSGGLKPDAGPNVIITRQAKWGEITGVKSKMDPTTGCYTATISLDSLMASRNPEENILMRPDDVVSIPRADLVYVVGDVQKAGGFQLTTHETVSLLEALALAGGTGPNSAAGSARILRQEPGSNGPRTQIPVDVGKILAGKTPDMQLYPNDVLFIPKSGMKQVASRAMEAAIGIGSGVLIYRQ